MQVLGKRKVKELILGFEGEEGFEGISEEIENIYDTYRKSLDYDFVKKYSIQEQESWITQITQQYAKENKEKVELWIERRAVDIKSLDVYYNFVGEEEVKKIQRAIIDNNINKDILKGIKVNSNIPHEVTLNTGEYIYAEFSSQNGSPDLVEMIIKDKDGNTVYEFGTEKQKKGYEQPPEALDDPFTPVYYEPTPKEKLKWKGIQTRIHYKDVDIIERVNKSGITQYVYKASGKFVKDEFLEGIK